MVYASMQNDMLVHETRTSTIHYSFIESEQIVYVVYKDWSHTQTLARIDTHILKSTNYMVSAHFYKSFHWKLKHLRQIYS